MSMSYITGGLPCDNVSYSSPFCDFGMIPGYNDTKRKRSDETSTHQTKKLRAIIENNKRKCDYECHKFDKVPRLVYVS